MCEGIFGQIEVFVFRPAERAFRLFDGLCAGRIRVRLACPGGGHAEADDGLDRDERRAIRHGLRLANGFLNRVEIVAVRDGGRVPAVSLETLGHVFGESERSVAFDGDVVIVVEIDEFAEFEMTGERGGFTGDAFHQVAVGDDAVDVMVEHGEAFAVKPGREMRAAHRHADAVGEPLAERPRCDLDAGREHVLRVAGSLRLPLAEALQFFEREVIARQVEERVDEHRAVPGGEQEAVAVRLLGVARGVAHDARPEDIGHRRGSERQTGEAGFESYGGRCLKCFRILRAGSRAVSKLGSGGLIGARAYLIF